MPVPAMPREIKSVAVIGGGTMGGGRIFQLHHIAGAGHHHQPGAAPAMAGGEIQRATSPPREWPQTRACDDCGNERACPVHLVMSEVSDAIAAILDNCTLADLVAQTGRDGGILHYDI